MSIPVSNTFVRGEKNLRLCRATAASFYVNTSLRAERNEHIYLLTHFIYEHIYCSLLNISLLSTGL